MNQLLFTVIICSVLFLMMSGMIILEFIVISSRNRKIFSLETSLSSQKTLVSVLGKEVTSFSKRAEQKEFERNQAHEALKKKDTVIRAMRGEVQIILSFLHGAFGSSEFATVLKNLAGCSGEEGFEIFNHMLHERSDVRELFVLHEGDGMISSSPYRKEYFELTEKGNEFFADPEHNFHLYLVSIGHTLIVRGSDSTIV